MRDRNPLPPSRPLPVPALLLAALALALPAPAFAEWTLVGVEVVPHVRAEGLRFRVDSPPGEPLAALARLVVRNDGPRPERIVRVRVDGLEPARLVEDGAWAWTDVPDFPALPPEDRLVPPGAALAWVFNARAADWTPGRRLLLQIESAPEPEPEPEPGPDPAQPPTSDSEIRETRIPITLTPSPIRMTAVAFCASDPAAVLVDRAIVHVANDSGAPLPLAGLRLRLRVPSDLRGGRWRVLDRVVESEPPADIPAELLEPGERGWLVLPLPPAPRARAALELVAPDGRALAVSALKIKPETFDISGGWTAGALPRGEALTLEPYLKTLARLHVNAAQIDAVPGYTDRPELRDKYPLKRFNRMADLAAHDRDELLASIHAVEFLGEPQYRGSRSYRTPQQVHDEFLPYAPSRLPTSVTLSDESTWRFYAGLSDFPHYDAYRVVAPAADAWARYDRWGGPALRWGAPLETIGAMSRSLRELSRPMPTAYWSQGPHRGWRGFAGRRRGSPTPDEIRAQAYHGLAARVTSLYWFNLSLESLVRYRDTLDELGRVGREIRALEDFFIEGDGVWERRLVRPGPEPDSPPAPDWDLAVIDSPRGGLLFALDLDYRPDPVENVFVFQPRTAELAFRVPAALAARALDVFRVDADGVHDPQAFRVDPPNRRVTVQDVVRNVAVYVVAIHPDARARHEARRAELVQRERALGFDPARDDDDFQTLRELLD